MTSNELIDETNLRYVSDTIPGITRKKAGKGFVYFNSRGEKISNNETLKRIKSLVIPPAWTNVWICPFQNGHIQATGYDAKRRKQYRYHPEWIEVSQLHKFDHMLEFAKNLPKIRKKIKEDMKLSGLPREKMLATAVWILEKTLIRVGNKEYEKENKSYGLTTLKNHHADISQAQIVFEFKGKSGVYHKVKIHNKKVVSILRRCQELPGQQLLEYFDENNIIQTVTSDDINEYLKRISNSDITAKDFRTWGGSIRAAELLNEAGIQKTEKDIKQTFTEIVKEVAKHLRNKPATCKKYYIHPTVMEAFTKGYTLSNIKTISKLKAYDILEGLEECENNLVYLLKTYSEMNTL